MKFQHKFQQIFSNPEPAEIEWRKHFKIRMAQAFQNKDGASILLVPRFGIVKIPKSQIPNSKFQIPNLKFQGWVLSPLQGWMMTKNGILVLSSGHHSRDHKRDACAISERSTSGTLALSMIGSTSSAGTSKMLALS